MTSANLSSSGKNNDEHVDEFLTPSQLVFMKRLVVVLGLIFIAGFIALVAGIIYKAKQIPAKTSSVSRPAGIVVDPNLSAERILSVYKSAGAKQFKSFALPPGAQIISSAIKGETAVLTIRDQAGYALMSFNLSTWTVDSIARFEMKPVAE